MTNVSYEGERPLHFTTPPVIEVALAIEYVPLASWTAPYFGLFWALIRDRYPRLEMRAMTLAPGRSLDANFLPIKCLFLSESGSRIVQIQDDRLVINWRKVGVEDYPRYDAMRQEFQDLWQTLTGFAAEEKLGNPQVLQCESTYVNQVDSLVNESEPLNKTFAFWAGGPTTFLEEAKVESFSTTMRSPDLNEQVAVSFHPAFIDNRPTFQLVVTTRAKPSAGRPMDAFAALDSAHNWNNRSFIEFTTPEAQKHWGRDDV